MAAADINGKIAYILGKKMWKKQAAAGGRAIYAPSKLFGCRAA
jgi:hypothetical protein